MRAVRAHAALLARVFPTTSLQRTCGKGRSARSLRRAPARRRGRIFTALPAIVHHEEAAPTLTAAMQPLVPQLASTVAVTSAALAPRTWVQAQIVSASLHHYPWNPLAAT